MYVEPKDLSQYPFYLRWFFKRQEKKIGKILIPGLFWGRIPKLQILFVLFWGHLDRTNSSLEPSLRALVQVRVAQINWCDFCIDYNALNLLERTNSIEKVDVLKDWATNSSFTKEEKVALHYVEEISKTEVSIPDDLKEELKNTFTDDQIIELAALISFQNMSAKFNSALDIPAQGMCKLK